ncbi:MAG: tetratricopeptide repeat protein [Candidatus Omnitrophota bacterium]
MRCLPALAVAFGVVSATGVSRADTPEGIAHFIVGTSFEFQGQLDAALLEYSKAAQADPSSYPIQMRLGLAAVQAGSPRLAITAFGGALQLQPDDLQVRYLLAVVYASIRDYDNAARQYEIILQKFTSVEPENADFYLYLGQLYLTQGKVEQAVAQFEKVLLIQPDNTELLLEVGSFYLDHSRRKEGMGLLKRCVEVDPVNADCLNGLGYTYAQDRVHLDEAAKLIQQALKIESDNAAYLDSMGWVRYQQGQWQDALVWLQKAADKENDPTIFDHIGDVYRKMNRLDKALDAWRQAVKMDAAMVDVSAKILSVEQMFQDKKPR